MMCRLNLSQDREDEYEQEVEEEAKNAAIDTVSRDDDATTAVTNLKKNMHKPHHTPNGNSETHYVKCQTVIGHVLCPLNIKSCKQPITPVSVAEAELIMTTEHTLDSKNRMFRMDEEADVGLHCTRGGCQSVDYKET